MTDLSDFIALSLLPVSWVPQIAERLRAGRRPGDVFDALIGRALRRRIRRAARTSRRGPRRRSIAPRAAASAPSRGATRAIRRRSPRSSIRRRSSGCAARCRRSSIVRPSPSSDRARRRRTRSKWPAQLAADLASRGLTIVSGLARGVDSAAHRGALAGGGQTIAVLGSGVDVMYPPEHAPLAREIEQRGAVVSELAPGTPPHPVFFPQRNRIISGLSRAVVVIEAGEKSGSLITARCALDQGRDVLAVPGNVLSGRNRGAHALLRDGAKIVESADDILEELGLFAAGRRGGAGRGRRRRTIRFWPV